MLFFLFFFFFLFVSFLRWLQFGTFSPVFRTHPSKHASNPRRIWVYPPHYYNIMRNAMLTRAALVPYIYTYARFAYDSGVYLCVCVSIAMLYFACLTVLTNFLIVLGLSLMRPMYYEFPEVPEAYSTTFDRQVENLYGSHSTIIMLLCLSLSVYLSPSLSTFLSLCLFLTPSLKKTHTCIYTLPLEIQ